MNKILKVVSVLLMVFPVLAKAQSGVGLPPFDVNTAFHVKNTPFTNPLRLDGLQLGTIETDVLVKDATGILRYRPMTDLALPGEWSNHTSNAYIYANRALLAGNDVVVTSTGRIGIGLDGPTAELHVVGSGLIQNGGTGTAADEGFLKLVDDLELADIPNRGVQVMDRNEYVFFGMEPRGTGDDAIIQWGDGNGQDLFFQHETGNTFTTVMHLDGDTKNVGIGETVPAARLDVAGDARIQTLPAGSITGAPGDDQIVTADANGDLRKITASDLFMNITSDGDWIIDGDEMYNANSNTVGIGTTDPDDDLALHIDGTTRLEGSSRLEFENDRNYFYRVSDNDIRSVNRTLFRFRNRDDDEDILVIDADDGNVGVGTSVIDNNFIMEIEGDTKVRDGSAIIFGDEDNNSIYSSGDDELTVHLHELFVVRDRGDDDVLTANNDREVGIRTTTPTAVLDVNGDVRIRDIPSGDPADDFLTVDVSGNVRNRPLSEIEGPWDRIGAGETFLRNLNDRVGIGIVDPDAALHIYETTGTQPGNNDGTIILEHGDAGGESSIVFKSAENGTDYGYISYADDGSGNGSSDQNSLLTIGVENDDGANQDDIAIMASGNVGVNTTTATAKFHVNGTTRLEGATTVISTGTTDPLRLVNVQPYTAGPNYDIMILDASGNVRKYNSATASDRRLKENIKPMEGTLEKLLGMESVSFTYRKDVKDYPYPLDGETHYGVIAQQVQKAFPHAVIEKDGYLHIQEKELMGVVIAATKELSTQNAELKAANEHLSEQVYHMMMDKAELEKTVHSLKAQTSDLQTSMDQILKYLENGKQVQAGRN